MPRNRKKNWKRSGKKEKKRFELAKDSILQAANTDHKLRQLINGGPGNDTQWNDQFIARMITVLKGRVDADTIISTLTGGTSPLQVLGTWIANVRDNYLRYPTLFQDLRRHEQNKQTNRHRKIHFASQIGLDWTREQADEWLKTIPTRVLDPLPEPIPPKGYWVVDSDAIETAWVPFLKTRKLADKRIPRRPVFRIDEKSHIVLDIGPDESMVVYDKEGNLVVLVLHNFCGSAELLKTITDSILRTVEVSRSVRVSGHE